MRRVLPILLGLSFSCSPVLADYLGTWQIDDYVPIPAATHRFSTGAAYQPSALTYSIYKDGSTTRIDEDVDMTPASPFDSVTGVYIARRQLTAAAGFETGKNYTVVVKATVDSVAAVAIHTFQVEAAVATATALATAQADLDNPTQYKATGFSTHSAADVVTAMGTGSTLTSLATATALATAQADLDNPTQYKATGFSTHSAADVVTALGTGSTLTALATADNVATALGTGTWATALPWNAAWDAEVQSEAADALAAWTVDGQSAGRVLQCLLSFIGGKVTVSTSGSVRTYTYYEQDNATVLLTVQSVLPLGNRTAAGTIAAE